MTAYLLFFLSGATFGVAGTGAVIGWRLDRVRGQR